MKIKNKIIISLTLSALVILMSASFALATESDWYNLNPLDVLESGLSGTAHNCSPLTVNHGSVAAYPDCTITCGSGYAKSGNSCISSPPAAGGTGGSSGGYTYPAGCTSSVGYSTTTGLSCSGTTITTATSTTVIVGGQTFTLPILPANPTNEQLSNQISILFQIVAALKAQLALLAGGGGGSSLADQVFPPEATPPSGSYTRNLYFGLSGADVTALQYFLKYHIPVVYIKGIISGYFGALTLAAVQLFQQFHDIAQSGDPGYGIVGPKTRAVLNAHIGVNP